MTKKNTPAKQSAADEAAVVAQLDAADNSAPAKPKGRQKGFDKIVAAVSGEEADAMSKRTAKAFDERMGAEAIKNPANSTIQKSLTKTRTALVMPSAAAIMIAAEVSPDFINRSISSGSFYNVYAADKLADLVKALRDGTIRNAINAAIVKSLFAVSDAGETFSADVAKACASAQFPISGKVKSLLTRHTVSPGVAPTQTSSTMNALETLGAVTNVGNAKFPVYQLTDKPVVARLREIVGL